jgi:hypothetical protein
MSRAALSSPTHKAALPVFAIVLVTAVAMLAAAPAQAAKKPKPCWEQVIDDWLDNGRIDGVYSSRCLEDARRHLPEDIRAYSDIEEKIDAAIVDSARTTQGRGSEGARTITPTRPNVGRAEAEEITSGAGRERDADGPLDKALNPTQTSADTIPLPLIILAAFALLLLAAGAAGFAQRKLQARKVRSK